MRKQKKFTVAAQGAASGEYWIEMVITAHRFIVRYAGGIEFYSGHKNKSGLVAVFAPGMWRSVMEQGVCEKS